MPDISARLAVTASLVRPGRVLADIGTDHAYLPCHLVLLGITPRAIAADIAEGPLDNARKTVRLHGLEDKIDCRKSDGLWSFLPHECREIVIAGMGGILISEILTAAPWVKDRDIHLILQPMTHSEDVRRYLFNNGFIISDEKAVIDGKKTYIAFGADYSPDRQTDADLFTVFFGHYPQKDDMASRSFVLKQKTRLEKRLLGLDGAEAEAIKDVLSDDRLKGFLV